MIVRAYVRGVPGVIQAIKISHTRNGAEMYLEPDAAAAWERLCRKAEQKGLTLTANSAWRSNEHQTRLYDRWSDALGEWMRKPEHERGPRPPRPAPPGFSLHQSGLAVDINRSHDDPDGAGPMKGPTDEFLDIWAPRFGFAQKVRGERWHWEFIGTPPDMEDIE